MSFNLPYMVTQNTITVVIDSKTETVESTNEKFEEIKEALKAKDEAKVRELIVFVHKLQQHADSNYLKGNIKIEGGLVLYNDVVISNVIVDRILKMQEEGYDIDPMIAFLNNLMENPSRTAVQELYLFLEGSNLPITPDGHFLAYKRVKDNYRDFHSGLYDNSIGKVLEIPRNQVDDNRDNHCSYGLHFCSLNYLHSFNSGYGHIMILKINPKDVVSIPSDYNNTKGRTCRYEIIGEHELDERTEAFDSSVYDYDEDDNEEETWDEWEDEEEEDDEEYSNPEDSDDGYAHVHETPDVIIVQVKSEAEEAHESAKLDYYDQYNANDEEDDHVYGSDDPYIVKKDEKDETPPEDQIVS